MQRRSKAALVLLFLAISGCAASPPLWRDDITQLLQAAREKGGAELLPAEVKSVEETAATAEMLMQNGKRKEAESLFHLAWLKASLLEEDLEAERARRKVEAEQRKEQERLAAEARKAREEAERVAREEAAAKKEEEALRAKKKQEKAKPVREAPVPLVPYHTVKRGETLPQIAAQANVYNDISLWPLIYRANRDQISNPRHIWPGQVLKIPRNVNRDDIIEARRYAQERRLY